MSEFHFLRFRAVDQPLSDEQLQFMKSQSETARVTKRDFIADQEFSPYANEVGEMLRGGYDIYLVYTSYGRREFAMRLPEGLPFPESDWPEYLDADGAEWEADEEGDGGIMWVEPYTDEAEDNIRDFDKYIDALICLREMLIAGDARAMYLIWLCVITCSHEDRSVELGPPIPHGLGSLPSNVKELLSFCDLDPRLVDAAAEGIPEIDQPVSNAIDWPYASPTRTMDDLLQSCNELLQQEDGKKRR